MPARRVILGVIGTAGMLYLLALSSGVSVPWHDAAAAELRLSWSARPERIEVCRELTAEEIAVRPAHMRQAMECEGRFATYALEVAVDDSVRERSVVRGAGLRNDRPIYLLKSIPVTPGPRHVRVTFERRAEGDSVVASPDILDEITPPGDPLADPAAREAAARRARARAAIPPALVLDTIVEMRPGAVVLVTYDAGRRRLFLTAAFPLLDELPSLTR